MPACRSGIPARRHGMATIIVPLGVKLLNGHFISSKLLQVSNLKNALLVHQSAVNLCLGISKVLTVIIEHKKNE
jgi:hypothetical protein